MKYLMIEQIAAGHRGAALHLLVPEWLAAAWRDTGTYPFSPPFVYPGPGGEQIFAQPLTFLILTAPLFAAFGWAGLFVLPMLAVVLMWLRCWRTCAVLELDGIATAAALGTLIFGLGVTPYGAMFWEHAPATALAFAGIAELVEAQAIDRPPRRLLLGGILLGSAAWFRPEAIVLAALVCAIWAIPLFRARRVGLWLVFATGAGLTVAGFLAVNLIQYGSVFGLQARQEGVLIEGMSAWDRARAFGWPMLVLLLRTAPAAALVVFMGILVLIFRHHQRRAGVLAPLVALVPAAIITIPWIVPNAGGLQWSARYLQVAIPVLAIAAGLSTAATAGVRWGRTFTGVAVLALFACSATSVVSATRTVGYMYQQRTDGLHEIANRDSTLPIVATDQYIPQELALLVRQRPMFVVDGFPAASGSLLAVARSLEAAGYDRFAFVIGQYSSEPVDHPPAMIVEDEHRRVDFCAVPSEAGDYRVYYAVIVGCSPRLSETAPACPTTVAPPAAKMAF